MSDAISVGALPEHWRARADAACADIDTDKPCDGIMQCADELETALKVGAEARTGGGWPTEATIAAWVDEPKAWRGDYEPKEPLRCKRHKPCPHFVSDTRLHGYCSDCAAAIFSLCFQPPLPSAPTERP